MGSQADDGSPPLGPLSPLGSLLAPVNRVLILGVQAHARQEIVKPLARAFDEPLPHPPSTMPPKSRSIKKDLDAGDQRRKRWHITLQTAARAAAL